jgi:hypothetical protein
VTEQSASPRDAYSPQLRTALVLTGGGTAGAYHAGVLRAFHEAGVKIDLVAGTGMGVVSALFACIDGGATLWQPDGLWASRRASSYYRVRPAIRVAAWSLAAAWSVVLLPFVALAAAVVVYPVAFLLRLVGSSSGGRLASGYRALADLAFDPAYLPSVLPRALMVSLTAFIGVLALIALSVLLAGRRRRTRRDAAPVWWRILGAPLTTAAAAAAVGRGIWRIVGGASGTRGPAPVELSRAYAELLRENLGQPGFRELLVTVHDLDVRRDFVFALVAERYRRDFFRPRTASGGDRRAAECFDLAGVARDHVMDVVRASLSFPVATEVQLIGFPAESFWCGEVHRACDRPGAVVRILDELPAAGIEQVILVAPFAEVDGPHGLGVPRGDWRGRVSDALAGMEAAALRSAVAAPRRFSNVFVVRPLYNPVGPLDVEGCYDERSDRAVTLSEVIDRGYEDAYRQFIDPVVGASGERLEATGSRRG